MAGPFQGNDYLTLIPADKKLDPAWVRSLFERGKPNIYRGKDLETIGMPIGGLCAGQVYLGGDGKLWLWDIFNKYVEGILPRKVEYNGANIRCRDGANYVSPAKQNNPFEQGFAIQLTANGKMQTRALDHTGFSDITFQGQYPTATVTYRDSGCPVEVTLEASTPFIPLDSENSSYPATIMRHTVRNISETTVKFNIAGYMENATCINSGTPGDTVHRNRIVKSGDVTILNCSAEPKPKEEQKAKPKREDIVFEDFERDTYAPWKSTGTAFGDKPIAAKNMPRYQGKVNENGKQLVNTHNVRSGEDIPAGDAHTGTLTSEQFTIERDYINFLIGGGAHEGRTCINLLIDGKTVRTATGKNSNAMALHSWNVSDIQGKTVNLQIIDDFTGGWGNIGIDHIVFSDTAVEAAAQKPLDQREDYGTMTLSLLGRTNSHAAYASFVSDQPKDGIFAALAGGYDVKDTTAPFGRKLTGGLVRSGSLRPQSTAITTFVITWHFPNLSLPGFREPVGRYYASKFNSAKAVGLHIAKNFDKLYSQTTLWRDTWYDSTLPYWLLDRTFANTSTLATSTCHRFANGRFYAWEGIGCCLGTCTHVWHYAQAIARVFPDLERYLRDEIDFGIAFNEDSGMIDYRAEFGRHSANDGQAGNILRAYREHQMTADSKFLERNYSKIKKATQYLIDLDKNDDGIIEGAQPNTLDAAWFGKIGWLTSIYLAALKAGGAMAEEMNDDEFAKKCGKLIERGAKTLTTDLFNGEYFIQLPDEKHLDAIGTDSGCYIDQVIGQFWAFQTGLGRLYSETHIKSALRSLWKYNFAPDVGPFRDTYKKGRYYALAGDGGLVMSTWPKGGKRDDWEKHWQYGYFNECMTGFEWQVAAHMIGEGMLTEGLAVSRAIHDRYDASKRNPYNEIECSDHYARAMASYGAYIAASGYEYHGPKGYIAFAPRLSPENFRAAFTAAMGWGTYEQQQSSNTQTAAIDIKYGTLDLNRIKLTLAKNKKPAKLTVKVNEKTIGASHTTKHAEVTIAFNDKIILDKNSKLEIEIKTS